MIRQLSDTEAYDEDFFSGIESKAILDFVRNKSRRNLSTFIYSHIYDTNYLIREREKEQRAILKHAMRVIAKENWDRTLTKSQKAVYASQRRMFFSSLRYNSIAASVTLARRGNLPVDQVRAVLAVLE